MPKRMQIVRQRQIGKGTGSQVEKRRLAMGAGQGVGPSRAPVIHHHQDGQPRQFYGLPAGAVIYDHALNVCAVVSQYDGQIARIFATTPIVAHGVHSFTML